MVLAKNWKSNYYSYQLWKIWRFSYINLKKLGAFWKSVRNKICKYILYLFHKIINQIYFKYLKSVFSTFNFIISYTKKSLIIYLNNELKQQFKVQIYKYDPNKNVWNNVLTKISIFKLELLESIFCFLKNKILALWKATNRINITIYQKMPK